MMNRILDSKLTTILGWALIAIVIVGGYMLATGNFPSFESKEEKNIERHFDSLSPAEQYDMCFYYMTTPTNEIAQNASFDGWEIEEAHDVLIPKMDELCDFDRQ